MCDAGVEGTVGQAVHQQQHQLVPAWVVAQQPVFQFFSSPDGFGPPPCWQALGPQAWESGGQGVRRGAWF